MSKLWSVVTVVGVVAYIISLGVSALGNETDVKLKFSWPSLDIESRPHWAKQPRDGVGGLEASINFWSDRLGLLADLQSGKFKVFGISGTHIVSPGTAAQRRYVFETHEMITRTDFHADMRVYLGNFIGRWSDKKLKLLKDTNLAFILGWNWQYHKFERYIDELWAQERPDRTKLPWSQETGYKDDHGGAYRLRISAPEIGISLNYKFYKEFSALLLSRYFTLGRAEYFGVGWQAKLDNIYGCDGEAGISYDFAKLLDLKGQRLSFGVGYQWAVTNGRHLDRVSSYGAVAFISYGFKHTW